MLLGGVRAASTPGAAWARLAMGCNIAITSVLVVVGLAAAGAQGLTPPDASGGWLVLTPVGIVVACCLVVQCWLLREHQPVAAVGLTLVGLAWMVPALAGLPVLPNQVAASLLAATPLAIPGIALVGLGWSGPGTRLGESPPGQSLPALSTPRKQDSAGRLILAASASSTVLAVLVHLIGYDPFYDPGCGVVCADVAAPLSDAIGSRTALGLGAAVSLLSAAMALVVVARLSAPHIVIYGATVGLGLFAVGMTMPWLRWGAESSLADLLCTTGVCVVLVASAVCTAQVRRARADMRRLVAALAVPARDLAGAGSLLAMHVAMPEDGRWVDQEGHDVDNPGPLVVVLDDAGGPAVRLVVARPDRAAGLVDSLQPVEALALENARLAAIGRARLVELQASQRRIVATADTERQRLERDLHDGAQQRLVAVAVQLRLAFDAAADGRTTALVRGAQTDVRRALAGLRELARDDASETLGAEGLVAALQDTVARAHTPVRLSVQLPPETLSESAQRTVVRIVSTCLGNVDEHARASRARVDLRVTGDELEVLVSDDGHGGIWMGPSLQLLADRVGALGGRFDVESASDRGTVVTARLPCA